MVRYGKELFKNDAVCANVKGNTPLHLAVAIKRRNQLELPRIEEMLISKTKDGVMLLHLNKDGLNPLMISLQKGSESSSDPVNVVKLMLESTCSQKLIEATDRLGNSLLHIAAKLDSIPLALSIVFAKTPAERRNNVNQFGNTPLSEAILNDRMNNALFIL